MANMESYLEWLVGGSEWPPLLTDAVRGVVLLHGLSSSLTQEPTKGSLLRVNFPPQSEMVSFFRDVALCAQAIREMQSSGQLNV